MGRGNVPLSSDIDADVVHKFFDDKVAAVRAPTADAPSPTFLTVLLGCALCSFRPLTVVDIVAAVRLLLDKQCMTDPQPTRLLKDNIIGTCTVFF